MKVCFYVQVLINIHADKCKIYKCKIKKDHKYLDVECAKDNVISGQ